MKSREEREKHYFDDSIADPGGSSLMEDVDDNELYDRVTCSHHF